MIDKTKVSARVDRSVRDARIARLVAEGLSERAIARRVGVSRTTVWTVKQALRRAGDA